MAINLSDSVLSVPGIGPSMYLKLEKKGITTIADYLRVFPRTYHDYSRFETISGLTYGSKVTVKVEVSGFTTSYIRRNMNIQKATVKDKTGSLTLTWFNQPYLKNVFTPGKKMYISGIVAAYGNKIQFQVREYEEVTATPLHTGKIVPVYSSSTGMSSKVMRSKMNYVLSKLNAKEIREYLPQELAKRHELLSPLKTLFDIHKPARLSDLERALSRITYEELFQLSLAQQKQKRALQAVPSHKFDLEKSEKIIQNFVKDLPYTLTKAQIRSIGEIEEDLSKPHPMSRLLLGDVGSGKTIVAALALYRAVLSGYRAIFLAPTEILAHQHYRSLKTLFEKTNVKLQLLTGKEKSHEDYDICVATHAVLYKSTLPSPIGIIIIDEQHKFGVEQRDKLIELATQEKIRPHVLSLSATPIPRSLALVIHGALSMSVIDELPPGREKTVTRVIPETRRENCYEWMRSELRTHKTQAYVICPLIEDSEELSDVTSVNAEFKRITDSFSGFRVGVIHGKTKGKEKIMEEFHAGRLDILVSTTVVEVGVDVPNATIMIIENAERFGLAQLHQLRGRIGRERGKKSYCFLFTSYQGELQRLSTLEKTNDGFELAEADLKLRGPGNLLGSEQHGFSETVSKHFSFDPALIQQVKQEAEEHLAKAPRFTYNSVLVNFRADGALSLH